MVKKNYQRARTLFIDDYQEWKEMNAEDVILCKACVAATVKSKGDFCATCELVNENRASLIRFHTKLNAAIWISIITLGVAITSAGIYLTRR